MILAGAVVAALLFAPGDAWCPNPCFVGMESFCICEGASSACTDPTPAQCRQLRIVKCRLDCGASVPLDAPAEYQKCKLACERPGDFS